MRPLTLAVVIPARLASGRFPGKVLAAIDGEPMLKRVWQRALAWREATQVLIATEDPEVAEAARSWGADTALSGAARTGSDRVARIACELGCDVVVNLQADEIDVDAMSLGAAVRALDLADVGTVACPLGPGERQNRDCVKVVCDRRGFALYFSREPIEGAKHMGIYAYRPDFLRRFATWPRTPLEMAEDIEALRVLEHGGRVRVAQLTQQYRSINRPEELPHGIA